MMFLFFLPYLYMMYLASWSTAIFMMPFSLLGFLHHSFSPINTFYTHYSSFFISDILSIMLICLTIWTTILMILNSFKIMHTNANPKLFIRITLLLMLILLTAFLMHDLIKFYIFFEASLIPTLMIILIWGYQPERLTAGIYLMMYTVTASLPLLLSILFIMKTHGTTSWVLSPYTHKSTIMSIFLTLAFFVKIPMYPFHLWLPKAHVEAPVAGSMILASVLLKLGVYGLIRMSYFKPDLFSNLDSFILTLALTGSLLTSIVCLRTLDMKILIAYASVGHMGILIAAITSMSKLSLTGAMMMMIAHGLASSGMFSLANAHYEVIGSRSLLLSGGLLFIAPAMTLMWFGVIASNMAAPPSLNLMSEFLILSSIWFFSKLNVIFIIFIPFFSVAYSLLLFTSLSHGFPNQLTPKTYAQKPIYYLSSLLHIMPIVFLFLMPAFFSF